MHVFEIVYLVIALAYLVVVFKDEVHMLQQNSYMPERYLRWARQNYYERHGIIRLLAVLLLLAQFYFSNAYLVAGGYAAIVVLIVQLLRRDQKKPLVVTKRVQRIFFAQLILSTICIWVLQLILSVSASVAILSVVLSPMLVLLAVFLLMPVENAINRRYVNEAKAILASRPNLIKIAITGSYGKTSVKNFLDACLSEKYNVLITPGSFNTTLGVVRTIREYLTASHEVFVAEMGAKQRGDVKEICEIVEPEISIVTAVGPQHLDTFGSLENVRLGKYEIIDALGKNGKGFINRDYPVNELSVEKSPASIASYAVDHESDYQARNIRVSTRGTDFDVYHMGNQLFSLSTKLYGQHNVSNLLVCAAVAHELNVTESKIKKAVKQILPVKHRMEVKRMPNGVTIIDDAFNSNPVGSKEALKVLSLWEEGMKYIITPGMIELGEQEDELNYAFGLEMAKVCDFIYLVGVKQTRSIQKALVDSGLSEDNYKVCINLQEANDHLSQKIKAGDVVLYENDLPDTYLEK